MKAESRSEDRPTATGSSLAVAADAVEDIRAYQRAARQIVRDPRLSYTQAALAVLALIQGARKAEAPAPELAVQAILAEAWGYVSGGPRPLDAEAIAAAMAEKDRADRTLRGLLRDGYVRCPRCTRLLPDERKLDRQRSLRRAAYEDALRREAV